MDNSVPQNILEKLEYVFYYRGSDTNILKLSSVMNADSYIWDGGSKYDSIYTYEPKWWFS